MRSNGNTTAQDASFLLVTHSRALDLLARSPTGRTETFMRVHGWPPEYLDGLVRAGLVTTTKQQVGRRRQIEITRIKLTEAGRATLGGRNAPVVLRGVRNGGKPPKTKPKLQQFRTERANAEARANDGEKRPGLVTEIISLSPPPPGRERQAGQILSKFSLNELLLLAKALRGGALNVALP